jgi:acyl-CoA reductase-like NAD-dependent aldehyde dehydrogenase
VNHASMIIDGVATRSAGDQTIPVENPADRSIIGDVPRGNALDVDRAVESAAGAFRSWRARAAGERGRLLLKMADDIEANSEEVARLMALETGNALRTQSRPEVTRAAESIRYFGGVAPELKGTTLPLGDSLLSYTRREPLGVVAGIIPWNAPVSLAALKIGSALATGNCLVLKPSVDAPLAVLKLASLCQKHLPPGVLNVVTGNGSEAGVALAEHPLVALVSFTGSTEIGKEMIRATASRVARVTLELGGKNPTIVFPDCNDDATVDGVISGMRFTRQGQSCSAGSRLFLHASIVESFLARLATKVASYKIGDPLDETTDIGPLINAKQYEHVRSYIEDGVKCGASVVIGGVPDSGSDLSKGYFMKPTVLSEVDHSWRVAREEIFGPVLVVVPWEDETDVLRMANESHYGLTAFIWCRDSSRALRAAHAIDSGWVQVNRGLGQIAGMSYGGMKQSGWGREFSLEGAAESLTQVKNVTVNLDF